METKPDYKIDLKIPRPHEIQVNEDSPTLDELKEYRDAWLQEAVDAEKTKDLITAAKTLCGRSFATKRYIHKWKSGQITLIYHVTSEHSPQHVVYVENGEKTVALIHEFQAMPGIDFWIPGDWVGQIKYLVGAAEEKMISISKEKAAVERQEMLDLLGLGG